MSRHARQQSNASHVQRLNSRRRPVRPRGFASRPGLLRLTSAVLTVALFALQVPAAPGRGLPAAPTDANVVKDASVAAPSAAAVFAAPPPNLSVTSASALQISLSWNAPAGVVNYYRVERATNISGPYAHIADAYTTTFTDSSVAPGTAYLYRVRAVTNVTNVDISSPSNTALGLAMSYTDDPLVAAVTVIKAQHFNELRQGVNAVRVLAGLGAASWTDPTLTPQATVVKAVHVRELRDRLDEALSRLGVGTPLYTDHILSTGAGGTTIKKVHVEELRLRAARGTSISSDPGGGIRTAGKIAFACVGPQSAEICTVNQNGSGQVAITNNSYTDENPGGSFDGAQIAFQSDRDGNFEIYRIMADAFDETRLTNHPAADTAPAWSPDAAKIAFVTNRDGNNEIYVMNADGTNPVRLTNHGGSDSAPAWSPDGAKIAFQSTRDGNEEIYIMNADGTSPTRLTNNPALDTTPTWSPGGTRLAFFSNRTSANGGGDGVGEIFVMNADGSYQQNLTNFPNVVDRDPSWSPDGTRIAFSTSRDGLPAANEIYVMNADGTGQTRITNSAGSDVTPDWLASTIGPGPTPEPTPSATPTPLPTPTVGSVVVADVVAFDQPFFYNRLGAVNPAGMIYALRRDVVPINANYGLTPGNVRLRDGKRA
ncbi:MAG TPA: fibronectin type III domain-containing protein, partial [Pyrinomonadaceae bacterium]|nr:fibronectin type III domain-containing protein [Pyrinomonadaceae bacterium]